MPAIECGRGHLYDPNIYSSCPYCNSGQQAVNFGGGVPVGADGKTMPIAGTQGGFGAPMDDPARTLPVNNAYGGQSVVADGKTLPPKGYAAAQQKRVDEDNKTIGMMREKLGLDPVVGWLVCVSGKQKGKDYRLKGQINTIGRSEKMDVCIKDDKTISNENHARLGYSEKNNRFMLIPAESKNIFYLNGEEVYAATPLNAYDVIDFGETKLLFIPLCCDRFDWNAPITRGEADGAV